MREKSKVDCTGLRAETVTLHRSPNINGVPVPYGATVEELRRRLSEPGPTAWAAFAALSDTPGTDALRLLIDYTRSADWRYRRLAVEAISCHALALEAADVLVSALKDSNTYVVTAGCRAVACHCSPQAHTWLVSLLSHTEPLVRAAAIEALARLWDTQDFEIVKRLSTFDASSEVRKEAARTLMLSADASNWRELYALWRASRVGHYRLWAVKLAYQFGGEESGQLLEGFQDDQDGHVRKFIAQTRMV